MAGKGIYGGDTNLEARVDSLESGDAWDGAATGRVLTSGDPPTWEDAGGGGGGALADSGLIAYQAAPVSGATIGFTAIVWGVPDVAEGADVTINEDGNVEFAVEGIYAVYVDIAIFTASEPVNIQFSVGSSGGSSLSPLDAGNGQWVVPGDLTRLNSSVTLPPDRYIEGQVLTMGLTPRPSVPEFTFDFNFCMVYVRRLA